MKISVIGLGFVGSAMFKSFELKEINLTGYDKYKEIGTFEECLDSDIIFTALPTKYNENLATYDKSAIRETLTRLSEANYRGVIVIKSTIEPLTCEILSKEFLDLVIVHNPEFLTERTAFYDFHNQEHIVIGIGPNCNQRSQNLLVNFYSKYYPEAKISVCTSTESESMKLFANSFYSVKIQFFNELYLLCEKLGTSYPMVLSLMLRNNWINPMHTKVPGPDGQLSYGGNCFPKDTNALLKVMEAAGTPSKVLKATIIERNELRSDDSNIIKK